MLAQSTGVYTGNHGLFQKYNIEALTLSAHDGTPRAARYGVLEMGRILEAVFRSLNNLLERFHQVLVLPYVIMYDNYCMFYSFMCHCIGEKILIHLSHHNN